VSNFLDTYEATRETAESEDTQLLRSISSCVPLAAFSNCAQGSAAAMREP